MHRIGWWTHRRFTLTCTDLHVFSVAVGVVAITWTSIWELLQNEMENVCVSRRTQFLRFRWTFFTFPTNSLFFHFPLALCLFLTATSFIWHCLMIMFYSTLASKANVVVFIFNCMIWLTTLWSVYRCSYVFAKLSCNAQFFCLISIRKKTWLWDISGNFKSFFYKKVYLDKTCMAECLHLTSKNTFFLNYMITGLSHFCRFLINL